MSEQREIPTIPRHNPINAITMGGIVRDAGLTLEEFRESYDNFVLATGRKASREPGATAQTQGGSRWL